jgi:hypothetical protein
MGVAEVAEQDSPISDQDAASIEGGIRALVRRNRLAVAAELIDHPGDNALMAGAASIADIDKLMAELQTARADRLGLCQGDRGKPGTLARYGKRQPASRGDAPCRGAVLEPAARCGLRN